jgi:hypothetical protein
MAGLDLEVLLHHRRDARRRFRAGGWVWRNWNGLLDCHGGRKLQNFAARSYRFTSAVPVFHACSHAVMSRRSALPSIDLPLGRS